MNRYIIITPARDEETYLEKTIESVAQQTVRPLHWIIVNDGSRDRTGEIIDFYAAKYPWIIARHRPNRGYREAGGGVIATFYDGYAQVPTEGWDFLVKLDADLSFAPDYFELCFAEFAKDSRLGIGGGESIIKKTAS
jgi:biofilm PGA synthesis N-glycosyltransferase PgaC